MEKECPGWKKIKNQLVGRTSNRHSGVGAKFHLKMTFFNFWIKLTQKGYFRTKKNENYHRILHIQISLDSKFHFPQTISASTNQKKGYFRSKTQKMIITIEFFIFELV